MNIHWKDWCRSWNSNTLATWCEDLTHLYRPWCWEKLKAWGEGEDRGWDGWMASLTWWTSVWASSQSSLKVLSIELVMLFNQSILCCPLLLSPLILPSIRVFSNESVLRIRWPNLYSGLIPFRLGRIAVQGTLKSLLQHHSSKASILCHSAFFIVQLSHPYMPTGKTKPWLDRCLLAK